MDATARRTAWLPLGSTSGFGAGFSLHAPAWTPQAKRLLNPELIDLITYLHRELASERNRLLAARSERQSTYDNGELPAYPPATSEAASGDWRVAPIPKDLRKRRVEITGPVESPKMVINMLSRGADGAMADTAMLDFEDSMKPSWANVVRGVHNVIGAIEGTLSYRDPSSGKLYAINPGDMPVVMVRVRGLHLAESNIRIDEQPVSAGLFDLATCLYHTANTLVSQGKTPTYYIPKCEHFLEARWWNRLFYLAQQRLGLPNGTLRATFLIETLPAAFQIEEILYEIKEHAAGLNVGRWDKIFSDIKVLRKHSNRILADRATINLSKPWMLNYAKRLINICHARGAYALGGMAAFTPGKTPELRAEQTAKVLADKRMEWELGHDGCWVSHPYFIAPALSAFPADNQIEKNFPDFDKYPNLLPEACTPRTTEGLRKNIRVGIAYQQGWSQDLGCIAWDNLMEDLATLEISRAQTWQWLHHTVQLDDGQAVTKDLIARMFKEELAKILADLSQDAAINPTMQHSYESAARIAETLFTSEVFPEFLSLASELAE